MKDYIKYVEISNFKSIKHLKLDECKRVNLFIGYPNVGKSNIIEAMSLFSVPYLSEGENLNKLIRVENKNELFYDVLDNSCEIKTDFEKRSSSCEDDTKTDFGKIEILTTPFFKINRTDGNNEISYKFSKELDLSGKILKLSDCSAEEFNDGSDVMRYIFQQKNQWKSTEYISLLPPFGENIVDVLSNNSDLSDVNAWIKNEFAKNGLEYLLDIVSNTIKIQKRLKNDKIKQLPYSSIADTLQRIIFYKTAIASNENSVLLFEEPEAHAFPPYIKMLSYDIAESKSNQFFIATHSPIIVNEFIEDAEICKELAIYIVDFKDNQTIVKRLSDGDLNDIFDRGIDLFFDLERYLD